MPLKYKVTKHALWAMTFAEMAATRDGRAAASPADVLLGVMLISDLAFTSEVTCLGGYLLRASCAAPDDLPKLNDLGWAELPEEPSFAGNMTPVVSDLLEEASRLSQSLGAAYIGVEHLLISLAAESFDDDVDAWLAGAELTEAGILRQWVALLIRTDTGDLGFDPTPVAST